MDRPNFRRMERPAPPRQRLVLMGLLLLLCGGLLLGRSWMESQATSDEFEVVEVRGEVPHPGFHAVLKPVTISSAVAAAGGHSVDASPVAPGSRVVVSLDGFSVQPMDQRLVFGLPICINTGSQAALRSVPGIGPARAEAIVQDRKTKGPFQTLDDLTRVRGIGAGTLQQIRPFVTVK